MTRFSGRAAPPLKNNNTPNVAAWVMNEAYSHECSSIGFGPAMAATASAAFYAYAYPEPKGFSPPRRSRPQGAAYNADVGQFLLDYNAVAHRARHRTRRCSPSCRALMRRRPIGGSGIAAPWSGSLCDQIAHAASKARSADAVRPGPLALSSRPVPAVVQVNARGHAAQLGRGHRVADQCGP